MEVERRVRFQVIENSMTRNAILLSVYVPWASPMQLHTFMLGIDVARRALLLISTPPFRYFRRGQARAKDNHLYPVWGDDTIWKMPGQLCSREEKNH